jgi:hypothetical protein
MLEKPKKAPNASVTYMPECILSSLGKLMEITVKTAEGDRQDRWAGG